MNKIYIALENIRSLYNIGAILRTCSFFGVTDVILLGYSGKNTLPNGKIVLHDRVKKTALGAEQDVNLIFLETADELISFAKSNNLDLVCVEQHSGSVALSDFKFTKDSLFVFGNETAGVSDAILQNAKTIVEIPRLGKHNSLNVEVAVSVLLYHLSNPN